MQSFKLLLLFFLISCDQFTSWQTPKGGDFILQTPNGELNSKSLRGKTIFLFFGFLHCPYVCPTTVQRLQKLSKNLPQSERDKVAFIFVSVDTERDTLPVLKEYFKSYDSNFYSATGDEGSIRKTLKQFGGNYQIIKGKEKDDVFIDHTTSVFVINEKGQWVDSVPFDASNDDFLKSFQAANSKKSFWMDETKLEKIKVLGFNQDCDLSERDCEFVTTENEKFLVQILPRPIRHLQRSEVIVSSSSQKLIPVMADIVGVEQDMGYIRPVLEEKIPKTKSAVFSLPNCDLPRMNWHLRLLMHDSQKQNYEVRFKFSSAVAGTF